MRRFGKMEKIHEKLTQVRRDTMTKLVQIQRDIFINSKECWVRTERASVLDKKHANDELKAEHAKISEHISSNLSDYMVEVPKPFKNATVISERDTRANWKNPRVQTPLREPDEITDLRDPQQRQVQVSGQNQEW